MGCYENFGYQGIMGKPPCGNRTNSGGNPINIGKPSCGNRTQDLLVPKPYPTTKMILQWSVSDPNLPLKKKKSRDHGLKRKQFFPRLKPKEEEIV
ncbi:hypothetical protein HanIR_Chr08g0345921 [Helianthus annuus]|nr:hypothetical protein HanIR_Chr08g0345921 [Helianthus annuus]